MNNKGRQCSEEKIGDTISSVAAPNDTNLSDATA